MLWHILALIAFAHCYIDENRPLSSKATKLDISTVDDLIPSKKLSFIMFYSSDCSQCTRSSMIYDEIINDYRGHTQNVNFYIFEGQKDYDLMTKFPEIKNYPSFAYLQPQSKSITKIFSDDIDKIALDNWIKELIQAEYNTNPGSEFNETLTPSEICDNYNDINLEITKSATKFQNLENSINELTQDWTKRLGEADSIIQAIEKEPKQAENTWLETLTPFFVGILVGSLIWHILYARYKNKKK